MSRQRNKWRATLQPYLEQHAVRRIAVLIRGARGVNEADGLLSSPQKLCLPLLLQHAVERLRFWSVRATPQKMLARQTRAQKNAEHKLLHDRTVLSAPVQALALLLEVVQDARDVGLVVAAQAARRSQPRRVIVDLILAGIPARIRFDGLRRRLWALSNGCPNLFLRAPLLVRKRQQKRARDRLQEGSSSISQWAYMNTSSGEQILSRSFTHLCGARR